MPFFTWLSSCQYLTKCRWSQSTSSWLMMRRPLISSLERSPWQQSGRRAALKRFEEALFETAWKIWATSRLKPSYSIIDAFNLMAVGVTSFFQGVCKILDAFEAERLFIDQKRPYIISVTRWHWRVSIWNAVAFTALSLAMLLRKNQKIITKTPRNGWRYANNGSRGHIGSEQDQSYSQS